MAKKEETISLIDTFSEFKELKNIDRTTMVSVLEESFRSVIAKMFGTDENYDVIVNPDKGDFEIWRNREVVADEDLTNPNMQISLTEAQKIDASYEVGEEVTDEVIFAKFGRRAILNLRQTLASKILELEKDSLYNKYIDRVGTVISAEVYQIWKKEMLLLDDEGNELLLPKTEQIPSDFYRKGETARAVVARVDNKNNNPKIILSRTSPVFLQRLFEMEVPEINDGLITIKKIARIPGERAKIAVESYDDRIDPVGACVGVKGSRIHGIVRELRNENIDVINYTSNIQLFIQRALSPAKISSIVLHEEEKKAEVYLKPEEVSLAIGKGGMNIKLASMLTEYTIDVYRELDESAMDEETSMTIRLNKVTRDLNVGITTVVEFLQKKGYTIEASPNAKITEEQYAVLVKEFSTDKNLKIESEKFSQERQNKDRNKASISIEGFESKKEKEEVVKTVIPEEARPKLKQVGKIDLDNLNKKTAPKVVEPAAKVIEQTPKAEPVVEKVVERKETPQPEKETPKPVVVEEKKPEPAPQPAPAPVLEEKKEPKIEKTEEKTPQVKEMEKETPEAAPVQEKEEDDVFKIRPTEFKSKINVVGQIDLAALNQSTRPKKKSKEEKRKEREEKDKQRQEQRKLMKDAIIKEIRKGDDKISKNSVNDDAAKKKKRNRINKERVDINAAGTTNAGGASNNNQRNDNANRPNRNNNSKPNGNNNQGGGKFNKDRFKKPVVKAEVSDEDVAKQVKETLARLTNKTKNKAAKYRKEKRENVQNRLMEQEEMEQEDSKILKLTEFVTANELASMMDIPVTQVIATCMSIGIMVSINQRLDAETINLVAEEFGYKTEYVSAEVAQAITEEEDNEEDLQPRAPIVTVMGHVDHGKTSLLDYIRKANVIAGEAGGITQHIGAYNVKLEDGRHITFLDTPGHEAFTAMRARGAKVTDIAIIIVAADDNVMPQTKEAINHAMAAGVPIVFAINKVDKPHANPDKIKEELAAMNFLVEEWGGKYQSQDISAKKGTGVHDLLEKVLLEAEMLDLKANPDRKATGSIIESSLDKGRGYVATMLVANGTLKMGDIVLAGTSYGKVKAMFNERNQRIKEAGPSEPVLILGLNGAPAAGDTFHVIDTEQEARDIANKREQLQREQGLRTQKLLTLDEVGRRLALGDFHELNVIVKGDVDGSVEALSDSLIKLSTEQVQVNVIHKGVGQISESDVTLAAASDAIIVGFQVRPSSSAGKLAEQEGVDIRKYSVIYDAIEEVKAAMEGMLAPTLKEQITATIEVREVFNITKVGLVAGAMVKTGKVKRSDKARLIRDGIVVFTGAINALKRFKDDVKEVGTNFECGISLTNCNDIKVGDIIEAYEEVEVKQTL